LNWKAINRSIGPGLLFASTSIGVSHLVQSTRAGAEFGFALASIIIAVNVFKFPFFEFGSRYAAAKGESLIDGYKRLGMVPLWIYFLVIILSMFFVSAAVVFVTAGFMDNLFGISQQWPVLRLLPSFIIFAVCFGILYFGKFSTLTEVIKVVGVVLLVSTLIAFVLTLIHGKETMIEGFVPPEIFSDSSIFFIIALMGWMPTALDLSTWNSLWTLEKMKDPENAPTFNQVIREFNWGYWITAALSLCFLTLGAYLIYGTGIEMAQGSSAFANFIVNLYATSIGEWSYWIIALASFSIMFGTSIGVLDGYSRALNHTTSLIFKSTQKTSQFGYRIAIVLISAGAFAIILFFMNQFKQLIDLATTISFVVAPFIAVANLKLVTGSLMPNQHKPSFLMRATAVMGIIFLTGFAAFYLWKQFF
jgi:Mn2+/Fe2+ NRAMP family transporter